MTGPYGAKAADYHAAGWSPLPLPAGQKWPPPKDWTGADAPHPSTADVHAWTEDQPDANLAIRMPPTVVGIDVDAYVGKPGGKTLKQLEADLGDLPATVVSSRRFVDDDYTSGIRLYRIPNGASASWPGVAGPGIELIRATHRYAVAAPSVVDTRTYLTIDLRAGDVLDVWPPPDTLPELPQAWRDHFDEAATRPPDTPQASSPYLTPGKPCQAVLAALSAVLRSLDSGNGRHDTTTAGVFRLIRLGEMGHQGADRATRDLQARFVDLVTTDHTRTTLDAVAEYARMIDTATAKATKTPTPAADRGCCNGTTTADTDTGGEQTDPVTRLNLVNWPDAWTTADEPTEYVIPDTLPAGRGAVLYSPAGAGKSLLALEWAAAAATGQPILNHPIDPTTVLYIDQENDRSLILDRLDAMGYDAGTDLTRLHYSLLGDLDPLDTRRGADQLLDAVTTLHARLVILDTTGRAVSGEENSADTYHALYRHTVKRLKAAGVAFLRLDHAGKDPTKGQRGSSAKGTDVDLVYRLTQVTDDLVTLTREKNRPNLPGTATTTLRRTTHPLRHTVTDGGTKVARIANLIEHLDELDAPDDTGRDRARQLLTEAGVKARDSELAAAVKQRRSRVSNDGAADLFPPKGGGTGTGPGSDPAGTAGNRSGTGREQVRTGAGTGRAEPPREQVGNRSTTPTDTCECGATDTKNHPRHGTLCARCATPRTPAVTTT